MSNCTCFESKERMNTAIPGLPFANHAVNCPLFKPFDKDKFEKEVSEVAKTFEPTPNDTWEDSFKKDLKNYRFHLKGYINETLLNECIKEIIKSHDSSFREKIEGLPLYPAQELMENEYVVKSSDVLKLLEEVLK